MARVRRSRAEWIKVVRAFERSNLSAADFAAKADVGETTLRWWRSQLAPRAGRSELAFVDVVLEEAVASDPFVVIMASSGHRVVVPHGFDSGDLRRLVDALC